MFKILTFSFLLFCSFGCKNIDEKQFSYDEIQDAVAKKEEKSPKFALVIHGGAGTILKENMSDSLENAYRAKLEEAIRTGYAILEKGGPSLEAVMRTINVLEDSPLFNAGKGAVFTHEETNELDASIMDGATLNAGAVAGVTHIKNPINLAYEVMENSPHVLLAGKGAEEFAQTRGFDLVDPSYFYTENRFQSLQRIKEKEANKTAALWDPYIKNSKFGTVGCVALDKAGNIAAGTSTGGMTNKRWNRIGDSPIIGAGTYANNNTCGVSSTGWGEYFIRALVAHDISALMEYKGLTLQEAAAEVIQKKVPTLGGDGGVVALDREGNIAMEFNTAGMYRAYIDINGELYVGIYK
ncbi:MAG TPA: isoaspartyl peptidase/L-asparaginase [Flavobacteriaceae bacterium]|nr:isoaspartyl peptidase/L-asparaginase [Flavobacteriaceae bacterium]MCB9212790.1 isoaspartyl peptidase/L-asparaginase [Alteromonas sp.]HPF10044.1 isoaspartyl peptidase/L-asparaginase [Flavobacteriaceae bacterium]HQU21343.1 isoaspartyl peptidase/L-asparaginase [Flavobacteriaceae bacterium]HQU63873.1 isoaspartyl peptidase/L-asparaginase [Flavobacteriaceae bacterium]